MNGFTIMDELLIRITNQADKIMQHIYRLFESIFGYILFCGAMVVGLIAGEKTAFTIVGLAIFFDFILGVWTSIKQGKFAKSQLIQDTFIKVIVYGVPLLLIGLSEKMFHEWGVALYVACSISIACELWSISAHLLIIAPNMPFLRLLRFQLKDEIKSKTGKDIEELTKEIKDATNK